MREPIVTKQLSRHITKQGVASDFEAPIAEHAFWEAARAKRQAEIRAAALDEAAEAMRPMLRGMISRSEAARIILELKEKST